MDIFVKRPIIAVVLSLVILLAGVLSTSKIPVLQFPQLESASLVINTAYPGASSDVVQGFITSPIERVAMTIPGVDYVDSYTTAGNSMVTAWLNLNENSTEALAQLTSRLSQISYELPSGAQDPSVNVVRADRNGGLFYLDVQNKSLSRSQASDYLTRNVTPLLASINGVQSVALSGGRNPAMRVWLDPLKMASLNVGANDVMNALRSNNVVGSLGNTQNTQQEISILSNATLQTKEQFQALIIYDSGAGFIRLGDVANIELGEDTGTTNARLNQKQTIFIEVTPKPGANEIEIGDELYVRLAKINNTLPDGLHIAIGYDGTLYMRDALKEILVTLAETIVLVGAVVLILMGSLRASMVPLITIPISILGSLAAMLMMGFSLNLLTVLAIVLSVGLVVDDAIVVVENVARHMRDGKSRIQAALISSRELLAPITAMTITLAAVYAPIGFVSGLSGALFKEFAFTLAIAVLISGVVAVTLSPIMSAYVSTENGEEGKFTRRINAMFSNLSERYETALLTSFKLRPQILTTAVVFTLLMVPFYLFSAKELAPIEDQSSMLIISDAPAGASLQYSTEQMHNTVATLQQGEGVDIIWQVINAGNGFSGINYVDYAQRNFSTQEVLPKVYGQLTGLTGLKVFPILPLPLPTAGQFDVELVVQSQDSYENMAMYTYQLIEAAYKTNQFMFADTDLKVDMPLTRLQFDHSAVADIGMNINDVMQQISAMVSEQEVNRFDANGKAYKVIPRLQRDARDSADSLMNLHIKTPSGEMIPLSTLAHLKSEVGPRKMGNFDQQHSFRILGGIAPGTTNERALSALEEAAQEILPAGYTINYGGVSRQLRKEGNSMISVLLIALVVVYLVLTIQFNSFRSPLVVLLGSVPLALSGAMMFSFLGLTSMNIYAQIGFITLMGLIAKNGILMTEFANELQHQGQDKLSAIIDGAKVRLRPILMTTAATVLGHFPLVLVTGAGAEARNSIGIILVAGMVIGTLFTLFVLPSVYMLLGDNFNKGKVTDKGNGQVSI